ncbi:MAG: AAA family ATPase [Alphaproteobacteria bacterium]|nr:AAA family ATPase [Alphaproteobacteria bacterium]
MNDTDQEQAHTGAEETAGARLVPRITIQAFCQNSATAQLIEEAATDRRMIKAALTTHNGGIDAAVEIYKTNPTPNLVILETTLRPEEIPSSLERLADVCDETTKVVVVGHVNDVQLYRDLVRSGVSEYLVMPTSASALVSTIVELFVAEGAAPIGRTIGFFSAKGGAGSSTLAHNIAWAMAHSLHQDVLIMDMDLAFGTAGLNFNQDPVNGLADAVFAPDSVDEVMIDRLMSKAANHINLLTSPGSLERTYDFGRRDFEQIVEICQRNVPAVILDLPHAWNDWIRHTLTTLDEIVIVAQPDLANLRNAKNIVDTIKAIRPSDNPPHLIVNQVAMPKRPEIAAKEFAASIDCRLSGQIPFDPALFGTAANNGQMIAEVSASHKINDTLRTIALQLAGRASASVPAKPVGALPGIFRKLKLA